MKVFLPNFVTKPMDIETNLEKMREAMGRCAESCCDVIIYSRGCMLGAKAGILDNAVWFDAYCKEKLGFIGTTDGIRFFKDNISAVTVSSCEYFWRDYHNICQTTPVVFLNWYESTFAGQKYLFVKALEKLSDHYGTAFVLNIGGNGYSSHPDFYAPMAGVVSDGKANVYYGYDTVYNRPEIFEFDTPQPKDVTEKIDIDISFPVCYNQNPLIPSNVPEKDYCFDLFDMQSEALANRLRNINCEKVVLSLSGGLDSTMALLVCANTYRMLGIDYSKMYVMTQPGFGTSSTTKGLAYELCEGLGIELHTIDINESCAAALKAIGHDSVTPDVTFENVQARMRTLNALNIANQIGGLMVGTGDLSEEALGFSTYGGDHLSSYNVNCCVSKTVMRTMLEYVTELPMFNGVKDAVNKVLNIPVSPELVPHGGEILQKTEDILAPYKLIDFYIYCTVVTKNSPKEIAELAFDTFKGEFTKEYIKEKLKMFYRKFTVAQFKRSCAPECANLTHVSLLGPKTFFPSDGSAKVFLQDLE